MTSDARPDQPDPYATQPSEQIHKICEEFDQAWQGDITPDLQAFLSRAPDSVRTLGRSRGVQIPRRSAALKLLQFVRDEAHRFAQHYLHIRLSKRVLGEGHRRRTKRKRPGK